MTKNIKILIAGEGGQGIQTVSKILIETAYHKNLEVSFVPNYGVEQRGGVSLGYIQFGEKKIGYPKFIKSDILVLLSQRSLERAKDYINPKVKIIYNKDLIKKDISNNFGFNFDKLANELGSHKTMNMLVLGVIAQNIKEIINLEDLKKQINKKLAYKYKDNPELKKMNIKALEIGYNLK